MKEKVTKKEFTWYVIAGIFIFFGLTLIIFDIVGQNLGVNAADNWITTAQQAVIAWSKINIDWRGWGLIFFLLGILIVVITLTAFAKGADRLVEKEQRRQARLASLKEVKIDDAKTIEVETKQVEPK